MSFLFFVTNARNMYNFLSFFSRKSHPTQIIRQRKRNTHCSHVFGVRSRARHRLYRLARSRSSPHQNTRPGAAEKICPASAHTHTHMAMPLSAILLINTPGCPHTVSNAGHSIKPLQSAQGQRITFKRIANNWQPPLGLLGLVL